MKVPVMTKLVLLFLALAVAESPISHLVRSSALLSSFVTNFNKDDCVHMPEPVLRTITCFTEMGSLTSSMIATNCLGLISSRLF